MIILEILKIIGIILLILLGLILMLLLLILFFPVSYRVKGKLDEENAELKASVYWLFHALGYRFSYIDGEKTSYYNIFFIRKHLGNTGDEEAEETEDNASDTDSYTASDTVSEAGTEADTEADTEVISNEKPEPELEADFSDEDDSENVNKSRKSSRKSKKIFSKIKSYVIKFKAFWNNPVYRRAFDKLKRELIKLLTIINPKHFRLNLSFSAGSPDLTGQALGLMAIFPIVYQNRWKIYPDFQTDKAYARGKTDISGKIYLVSIIGIIIRILVDKDCRKLYNDFKK